MYDGHNLTYYNIQAGSTVTLVLRLRTFDPTEETPAKLAITPAKALYTASSDKRSTPNVINTTALLRATQIRATLTGSSFHLTVEEGDTILRVKERIQYLIGIPPKHQWLLLGDTVLDDGHNLTVYNIQAGSIIKLVLRLRTFDPTGETPAKLAKAPAKALLTA
ncbi:polyubiquitin-like [Tachysurus vachellii]|uniref:polyubiquitin-like n=1 Tax=Tachysurus vachellii TaxID=175792 RepID=UPI00296B38FE|nr:polyubiquitin-like [Tachysurus vachellii]